MCALDNPDNGIEPLSLDEGSSSLSSLAEDDQDISDLEVSSSKRGRKVKMMCSYGGRILPRPQDGQLRYVGGETRILVVKKNVRYKELMEKLCRLVGRKNLALKYQLPNEDLDALISVRSDEDVGNMMDEYDKVESRFGDGSVKLRVFLFPAKALPSSPSRTALAAAVATETEYSSSDESSLVDSAKMGVQNPRIPRNQLGKMMPKQQDDFGSLRLYQEQQQQQQQHSPRCAEGKTRSHFQDGENGHLDLHHQNQNPAPIYLKNNTNQGTNFLCKGCPSCAAARPPHPLQHHMLNHYHQYPPPPAPYHHHHHHPAAPAKFANLQYTRHELPPIVTTKIPYDPHCFYSNNHSHNHGHLHYQQQ